MIPGIFALLALAGFFHASAYADQTVLGDDGREVLLRDDGTWEYLSEDRFAISADGKRIRMKPDGTWVESDNERDWVTLPAQSFQQSRDVASEGEFEVELAEIRVESVRTKQQKNTRLRSQIVATLVVSSEDSRELGLGVSSLTMTDSRGREYPVVSISPERLSLQPGSAQEISLIADGSPRWWGVKFFRLEIQAGVLGKASVELTKAMSEVSRLELEALTQH